MKIEAELYQTDLVVPEIYWEDGVIPVETEENGGHAYYFQEEKNRRREEEEEEKRFKSLKKLQTEFETEIEEAQEIYKNEVITINREVAEANINEIIKEQLPKVDPEADIMEILAIIEATS